MLIDDSLARADDWISRIIGNGTQSKRLEQGCYLIGHFGSSDFMPGYESYPLLSIGSYGVCDSLEQLKNKCPELEASDRKFVVTLTEVRREDQPASGGWRWHKWGEYIGDHSPQHEYLYDEEGIERVFAYHIYEKEEEA